MAWRCSGNSNQDLVLRLKQAGIIRSPRVEAAFLATDRKHFAPQEEEDEDGTAAYEDRPLRRGALHISAPHIYAQAAESLGLEDGAKFLCIGSGSGYFSTIVSHLLGPTGVCHGVEIHPENVEFADAQRRSYTIAIGAAEIKRMRGQIEAMAATGGGGSDAGPGTGQRTLLPSKAALDLLSQWNSRMMLKPQYVCGNAFNMQPRHHIRYDRIYVAGGVSSESARMLYNFLEIGGMLIGPVDDRLVQATRRGDNSFSVVKGAHVRFAPLRLTSPDDSEDSEPDGKRAAEDGSAGGGAVAKRRRITRREPIFAPQVWTPRSHARFPDSFRRSAESILMLQRRRTGLPSRLPKDTWLQIIGFMDRDWFKAQLTEVEILRSLLAGETTMRKAMERKLARVESERDQLRMRLYVLQMQLNRRRGDGQGDRSAPAGMGAFGRVLDVLMGSSSGRDGVDDGPEADASSGGDEGDEGDEDSDESASR